MPAWVDRLDAFVARSTRVLALVGLIGLLVQAGATIVDVAMRWAFSHPIAGLSAISELVIIFMVAACFPAALAGRHHIAIRFLGKAVPWRVAEALEVWGHLLVLGVVGVMGWQLVDYTWDLYATGQTTWLLLVPMWPSWSVATALIVLCVPVQAAVLLVHVQRMLAPAPPVPAKDEIEAALEDVLADRSASRSGA